MTQTNSVLGKSKLNDTIDDCVYEIWMEMNACGWVTTYLIKLKMKRAVLHSPGNARIFYQ